MARKFRRFDKDGNELDDENEFLRDGERLSISMSFMNSIRRQEIKAACDARNRHDDEAVREAAREAERAVYARRVSDAWRGKDNDAFLDEEFDDDVDAQRERYISRISNAWR